jgi:hypothetical protein
MSVRAEAHDGSGEYVLDLPPLCAARERPLLQIVAEPEGEFG